MIDLKSVLLTGTSVLTLTVLAVPASAQNANNSGAETVIVTGTRVQGMKAADSAAPVMVLGADALKQGTGSTDLRDAVAQMVPSFTAQQRGGDLGNMTLSAALRGLSPNDTLVLVNGHRRHGTANLQVSANGFTGGGASPDISLIPQNAIDHVEVLLDGAAAQYGTDAIGGVVNIILKKKSSGGILEGDTGQYDARDGQSYDVSFNIGLPLFDKGFANVTVDKKFNGWTQRGGADSRLKTATGATVPTGTIGPINPLTGVVPCSGGNCLDPNLITNLYRYPRSNANYGNSEAQTTMGVLNAGYDFTDQVQLYAFGSIGHRFAITHEGNRLPNQTLATPGSNQPCSASNPQGYNTAQTASGTPVCALGFSNVQGGPVGTQAIAGTTFNAGGQPTGLNANGQVISSGLAGTVFTPGELIFYPNGQITSEVIKEDDYQYNTGMKFSVLGWNLDANIGYGKDIDNIYTWGSGVKTLYLDTHTTPSNFYDGRFTASQFTGTIDAVQQFQVGLASPLTVAFGAEAREDTYRLDHGEAASYYKEGPQSFPGFTPSDAGSHSRKNYAGYIDLAVAPIDQLQLDVAGRFEHYTDFGDAQIGKITARYDFSPQIGIRGTIATGFRAPTPAEEYYTATNVSPSTAIVQLQANSPAAKVLGLSDLKPEISTSYSVGLVAHPLDDLSVTVDAYSITLGDRIVASGRVFSQGGAINTPLVNDAIRVAGNVLDPTSVQNGVTAFLNGLDTLTQGVDLTANYPTDFGDYGLVDWTLAGNFNNTSISSVAPPPQVLLQANQGATFFTPLTLYNFTHSTPNMKVGLTANWSLDAWGVTARETFYGPQHNLASPSGGLPYYNTSQAGVGLTDLEARYNITESLQLAIGSNNIFNIHPGTHPYASLTPVNGQTPLIDNSNIIGDPNATVWDPNGGYYYARVTFNF
jgi:iron complex outermembrane receptor protein